MFVVFWPVAVEPLAVDDALGADHACVADIDHVGVGHVQGDAKADQEDEPQRQPGRGKQQPQRARPLAPVPGARREHAQQQVDEWRVHERHRFVDLRVVEEGERDRQREQHEQVQVQQPEGPAEVEERREEQQAQRQPDVQGVDVAPEGALVATRHRPGNLKAGPLFEHPSRYVVDRDLRDLALAVLEK